MEKHQKVLHLVPRYHTKRCFGKVLTLGIFPLPCPPPLNLDPCPVLTCSPAQPENSKKKKKKKLTALCIPRQPVQSHTCWPLALTFRSAPKSDKPGMAGFRVQESRAARPRHRETVRVAHNPVVPRVLPDLVFSQADRHRDRQPDRQRLPPEQTHS